MNILDVLIILVLTLFLLGGMYRGFVSSCYKLFSYLLSILLTFLTYPLFAKLLMMSEGITKNFRFYAEGAEKLATVSDASLKVADLSSAQMQELVQGSLQKASNGIRPPIDKLILGNMEKQVFPHLTTVGEYFNETIVAVAINIIAFIIVFFILKLFFNMIINIYESAIPFPVLRQYDLLAGGLLGLLEGFLILMVLFSAVPLLTSIMTVKLLEEMLNNSLLGNFLVRINFIPHLIRSKV